MTSDCDADIKDENQVELTQSVELTRKEERRDRPRSGLRSTDIFCAAISQLVQVTLILRCGAAVWWKSIPR